MLRKYLALLSLILHFAVIGQHEALKPYIEFIEKQTTDPVDYVFELFDKYDIVILGERDHRDTTQYVLIEKIMSDPRFTQKVGHVFTEVGVCNQTDNANRVLKSDYLSEEDFTHDLRNLYRNIDYEAIWEKYNYWYFLNSIYQINKKLPQNEKITLHLADVTFDWSECRDTVTWKNFLPQLEGNYRDLVMGMNIIRGFDQILQDDSDSRKKTLVILNRPHSYQNYICTTGGDHLYPLNSAASYVFDYYPEKVANVMINWRKLKDKDYLISNGKWDAAFHFMNNPSVGFDMENSPFGEDLFDHYDKPALNNTRYKDIYTGFIFYLPIERWALTMGIPDIVTEDFHAELLRRIYVASVNGRCPWDGNLETAINYLNNKRTKHLTDYENIDSEELIRNLEKWNVK